MRRAARDAAPPPAAAYACVACQDTPPHTAEDLHAPAPTDPPCSDASQCGGAVGVDAAAARSLELALTTNKHLQTLDLRNNEKLWMYEFGVCLSDDIFSFTVIHKSLLCKSKGMATVKLNC